MDAERFDRLVRQVTRGGSRRALIGGVLATALLAETEPGADGAAKSRTRAERCTPAGRRCGKKKNDPSCKSCCHRFSITTAKGKKTCSCKPSGIACGNPTQCCSGNCQGGVCRATTHLSESGSGTATPIGGPCDPSVTTCQQSLSGVITSGSPIATGTATGTLSASNFAPISATEGAANTSGSITLTESATGEQLNLVIIARVVTTLATGAFNSSGVYTITGGTGRFAGASGAGSSTFSGTNNLMTGVTTITSFILSGDIIM